MPTGDGRGNAMGPNPEQTSDPNSGIDRDDLERAIAIYLELAYPDVAVPEAVRRRITWRGVPGPVPLHEPMQFESTRSGPETAPIYAIRLGNARYPHMKLQVQPWPSPAGFLLSVNTHDQVAPPDSDSPEAEAFRTLQSANQHYKQQIETSWEEAGLPTFLGYLKDYIQKEGERTAGPDVSPEDE